MKNAAGVWKFNKQLGSCVSDDQAGSNPGCKNLDEMIPVDSGLDINCKINKGQLICNLDCPDGTFFMGKDGKMKWNTVTLGNQTLKLVTSETEEVSLQTLNRLL